MAVVGEKNYLLFTWKIQNFSMCPHNFDEAISSPTFKMDLLDQTEWQFVVYPRGTSSVDNDDYISYGLRKIGGPSGSSIKFYSKFEIIATEGRYYGDTDVKKDIVEDTDDESVREYISRSKLIQEKHILLPNDTLTVRCQIWTNDDVEEKDDIFDDVLPFTHCSMQTQIRTHRKMLLWPMNRFRSLRASQKLCIPLVAAVNGIPAFDLTVSVSENFFYEFEIQRKGSVQVFASCKISVFDPTGNFQLAEESEYLFLSDQPDEGWKFPFSLKMQWSEVVSRSQMADALYIKCLFAFSVYGREDTDQGPVMVTGPSALFKMSYGGLNSLGKELYQFHKEKRFCDAALHVQDHTFPVHKIILRARSAVFRAMFDYETTESETGTVVIPDFSPDTVDHMLGFLYTEELEDLKQEDIVQLYSAADKYEILALKCLCAEFLKSSLSPTNVCQILTLATMHQDESLMEPVWNCISADSNQIFGSDEWKDLIKQNSELAADIMHRFIMSGMH